jgi:hypothetical protein
MCPHFEWLSVFCVVAALAQPILADKGAASKPAPTRIDWSAIPSPIILKGGPINAYRDPAGHYHDGVFRVFHTLCRQESDGHYYWYVAVIESRDLIHWSRPRILTPRDRDLNFSSPGNVVRFGDKWLLCVQTYPTPGGETFGTQDARIWTMASKDLVHWDKPQIMMVKGPDVPVANMGRMIDPYLIRDKDESAKWWVFYKQNGVSMSYTYDFKTWTYFGRAECGENVCVLTESDEYIVFHSPGNGIGVKRSKDLKHWEDVALYTLGQGDWPWAQGRLTAAHVLDLRRESCVGKYVMFFHGDSKAGKKQHRAHGHGTLGMAWSDDLIHWQWPEYSKKR